MNHRVLGHPYQGVSVSLSLRIIIVVFSVALVVVFSHMVGTSETQQLQENQSVQLPDSLPEKEGDHYYLVTGDQEKRKLTIQPSLQEYLKLYLKNRGNPIAAVVAVEVSTGNILAMVQGAPPKTWGSKVHTALYSSFPAASLFKTVVTAAAFEVLDWNKSSTLGVFTGCAHIRPSGSWLRQRTMRKRFAMTMERAYGSSCNTYFAKLAVNHLGMGPIKTYASKFGWDEKVQADFQTEASRLYAPDPTMSSVHTVGRFAAGFGNVTISPVHAAWTSLVMANSGIAKSLNIFADKEDKEELQSFNSKRVFSDATADKFNSLLNRSIRGGTATYAFRKRKFRKFRRTLGGKTGTLTGKAPEGLTTWFTGVWPVENPEVVVAAVVVNGHRWVIKGPHLAAETFWAYEKFRRTWSVGKVSKGKTQKAKSL